MSYERGHADGYSAAYDEVQERIRELEGALRYMRDEHTTPPANDYYDEEDARLRAWLDRVLEGGGE